jgi:hypothetical protein
MVWNIGFNVGMGVTYSLMEIDGDIRKIEYVDTTREPTTLGGGFEPSERNRGRAVKPDYVPIKYKWGGPKNRKLPGALCERGMLLVSDRIEVVEQYA